MSEFIVVCDGMDKKAFSTLQDINEFEVHPEPKVTPETLEKLLPKVSALVIRSTTTITSELLEKAPQLKYVIRAGEGTDNIDKLACEQKKVKVSNTPGANNNSAAEHALALTMTLLRKTAWAHSSMSSGKWEKSKFTGVELTGKTVGIVGFGRIGQLYCRRLAGFEPKVLFYDPFIEKSEFSYAQKAELEEVFKQSDIISIHTPLLEATKGLINRTLLESMKPEAVLINAARGGILDEEALYDVLKDGKIRGAALDVFAIEPLPTDGPLRTLDNLIMTPHLGASTEEAQINVGTMAVAQLQEFFLKNNLLNEVRSK